MMAVIFSTITQDVKICEYGERQPNRFPPIIRSVTIKGGANSPREVGNRRLITPRGIPTTLSDADMEWLAKQPKFREFMKKGYVTIGTDERDADTAAKNMTPKDGCAVATEDEVRAKMAAAGARGKDGDTGAIITGSASS